MNGSIDPAGDMKHPIRQRVRSLLPAVMAATLVMASCVLTASRAQVRDGSPAPSVVALQPIEIDESIVARGLDSDALTGAIRFVFSMDPDLQIVAVKAPPATTEAPTPATEPQLSGTVRNLQDQWVWTGDLRLPNRPTPSKLGPVTLHNGKTGRPEALREIAILVNRSIRQEATSPRSVTVHIACLRTTGTRVSEAAQDFRLMLEAILKSEPLLSVIADPGGCRTEGPVNVTADSYDASVGGTVTAERDVIDIEPVLSWRFREGSRAALVVPLPRFRGSNSDYAFQRRAYATSIARAISANTSGSCPWNILIRGHDALAGAPDDRAQVAADLLKAGICPFVALALLQRAPEPLDAETSYELGKAYRATGANELALESLEKVLATKPEWAEARGELASVLFDLKRYTQAIEEFKKALDEKELPDISARYAQAAYLIGRRDTAEEQIEKAVKGSEQQRRDPAIRRLAAQIAIENVRFTKDDALSYFKRALSHVDYGFNHTSDKRAFVRIAKDLAVVSMYVDNDIAAQALDLVVKNFPDDAEAYLIRGRVFLERKLKDRAIADFAEASRISKQSQQAATAPELRVIDLELSEAHFLSNNWKVARNIARQFLERRENSEEDGTKSYEPIAQLLIAAADIMEPQAKPQDDGGIQVHPQQQPVDTILATGQPWPTLKLTIPTGVETQTVPIAVWSFENFDVHACTLPAAEAIRSMSRNLQNALQVPPGLLDKPAIAACPPEVRNPG